MNQSSVREAWVRIPSEEERRSQLPLAHQQAPTVLNSSLLWHVSWLHMIKLGLP